MKVTVIKKLNNSLVLAYDSDYDNIKKLRVGKKYQCEIKRPRNYKFHKKFFALIKLVFDNQEVYTDMERLRKDLIIESGFYVEYFDFKGNKKIEAKSISFSKMSEEEFEKIYNRVLDTIVKIYDWEKSDILENVISFF